MYVYLNSHYDGAPFENKSNNFHVYFANPLELNGKYEVSAIQIDYDSYIWTFIQDDKIKIVYKRKAVLKGQQDGNNKFGIILTNNHFYIPLKTYKLVEDIKLSDNVSEKFKHVVSEPLSNDFYKIRGYSESDEPQIDNNDYISLTYRETKIISCQNKFVTKIEDFVSILNNLLENAAKFELNDDKLVVDIIDENITSITFLNDLHVTLGFHNPFITGKTFAEYKPQFERNTQSMYIYIDFIEESFVSNVKANLLKVIPYKSGNAHIVHNIKIPQYVNIVKRFIPSAHVVIKNEFGENFPFRDYCKTMIVLHIREK